MATLELLLGSWIDGQGSRYDVELEACGTRCTVATTRPSGARRVTRGLVRLDASGCIRWASSFKLRADPAAPESVVWANGRGGKAFEWFRQDSEDRKVKRKEKARREEKNHKKNDKIAANEDESYWSSEEMPGAAGSRQTWKKKEDSRWSSKPAASEGQTWKRKEQKENDETHRTPERESASNRQNWKCNQCGSKEDLQRDPDDPDHCYCATCWDQWEELEEDDHDEPSSDEVNEALEDVLRELKGRKLQKRSEIDSFAQRLLACFPREAHLELEDKGVRNLVHFRAHECKPWLQGRCSAGAACTFAHGKHEICGGSVAERLCAAARAMQALESFASAHTKDGETDSGPSHEVLPGAESDTEVQTGVEGDVDSVSDSDAVEAEREASATARQSPAPRPQAQSVDSSAEAVSTAKAIARQPSQMEGGKAEEPDGEQLQNKTSAFPEATSGSQPELLEAVTEIVTEGDRLSNSGNWQRAVHRYKAGLECLSGPIRSDSLGEQSTRSLRSKIHARLSHCYLKMEQFQDAEAEASRCLELTPTDGNVLVCRSAAREKLGDLDKALDDLEQAKAQSVDSTLSDRADIAKERILQAWQQHLASRRADTGHGKNIGRLNPARWADGLDTGSQYDWFINCYRMRVHEDYTGGGHFHGLYDPDAGTGGIAFDFLLFCKLAVARKAVPSNWDWSACLKKASKTLMIAFEKGDAQGSSQAYRDTAELIYGTSSAHSDGPSKMEESIELELARRLGRRPSSRNLVGRVLDDVGGEQSWSKFREKLGDDETDEDDDESWFGKEPEDGDEVIDSDCREEFWLCQQQNGQS
eukprot:TRINITY_DN47759_c0_g1_i1.p1 TRINITY_DN47759_c0_g1~~TRINITY_DN47759_c0_g1_i1.p1  ORF type:complete len:829 (-),score=163.30 TRINITY_DN47759_c0_g1_i1:10-2457(-)